jgi:hypothetical protein
MAIAPGASLPRQFLMMTRPLAELAGLPHPQMIQVSSMIGSKTAGATDAEHGAQE